MDSGLLYKIMKTGFSFVLILALSAAVFCADARVVSAESAASASVDSVNLRKGKWVYSVYLDKSNERYASVTKYDGEDLEVVIPAEFNGIPVRSVNREAFCNNRYITAVTLPDSVTDIGKYAFYGCIGIHSVTFPASLNTIGEGAFYGCWSLTEAVLPEGMTKIGSFAFFNCRHLQKVVFPSSLKSIGNSSFEGCGMLESIALRENTDTIGDMAFKGCSSLVSADLSNVRRIGAGVFMKCGGLESVILGDSITEIRPESFRDCGSLKKLVVGINVKTIGTSAFENCGSLTALPEIEGLASIGSLAFKGCSSLKEVSLGSNAAQLGICAFSECTGLTKILVSEKNKTFSSYKGCLYSKDGERLILCPPGFAGTLRTPGSIHQIDDYAAAGCRRIAGVVMGEELSEIGTAAFFGCTDVTSFSVPENTGKIGHAALGFYSLDHNVRKAEYLRVYGKENGVAESYCSEREIRFIPYHQTLQVSSERVVLEEGGTFRLTCGFSSQKKGAIAWESSDESVVKVSDGKLRAVSQGKAEIKVTSEGFDSVTVKVEVIGKQAAASGRKDTFETRMVYCGEKAELSSLLSQIIDPIFSSDRFWYSTLPAVATVSDDGTVATHSTGVAAIICHLPDGSENKVLLTVTDKPSALMLVQPDDEWICGQSGQIKRTMYPSTSSETIRWTSDNEQVATVDADGRLITAGQGSCTITASTESGLKSSVEIKCVIPAESLSLNQETRRVYQGKEFNLTASLSPEDSEQKVKWSSSDLSVASVNSKGKVTGKSFGTAVIKAETAGGLVAECRVVVVARAKELALDTKDLSLNCGDVHKLNALIRPSYSPETTDSCSWNSTDEEVATVDENGNVTAIGPGKCIINCRTSGDLISKCRLSVSLPAESVEITASKDSVYIGEVLPLRAEVVPAGSTDTVEWSSSDKNIARVTAGGAVKGLSVGTAVISATVTNNVTGNSVRAEYAITVMKKADSVRLSKSSLSLVAGENDFLTFDLSPDDSNDIVTWSSSDESVASVRYDGLITAVAPGTCYIRIETGSGCAARCKVTVS